MVFELIQLKTTFRSFGWLSSVLFGQNIFENIAIFALWCSRKDFLSICSMMEQSEMIATRVYEGGIGFGVYAWEIFIFGSRIKIIFHVTTIFHTFFFDISDEKKFSTWLKQWKIAMENLKIAVLLVLFQIRSTVIVLIVV